MKPEDNATTPARVGPCCSEQGHLDALSRIRVIPAPIDELADVSEAAGKKSIQIDEGDCKSLREQPTDRTLAGATGPDQIAHRATFTDGR